MSKAFTKDDDGGTELLVVPRAPLPAGLPNYVTPRGLRALLSEQASLDRERAGLELEGSDRLARLNALTQRAADLQSRISTAEVVDAAAHPASEVRFGALVRVRHEVGRESQHQLVGVDEADAESGRVAFCSPLARALLGKRVGEVAELRTPRGVEELEVLAVGYVSDGNLQESEKVPK